MNREEFLEVVTDLLQTEEELSFETDLEELEEWDSLSAMAMIAFIDKNFGIKLSQAEISKFQTIEEIAQRVGIK